MLTQLDDLDFAVDNWKGLPKTGGAGEMFWMAYAPGGVEGLSKYA